MLPPGCTKYPPRDLVEAPPERCAGHVSWRRLLYTHTVLFERRTFVDNFMYRWTVAPVTNAVAPLSGRQRLVPNFETWNSAPVVPSTLLLAKVEER